MHIVQGLIDLIKGKKSKKYNFAVIDDQFPTIGFSGFRQAEINNFLEKIPNSCAYSMRKMKPEEKAWFHHSYGIKKKEYSKKISKYLERYPQNKGKVKFLPRFLSNKLVYCYFLAITYTLLPYLNKNKLPFVFVLYPGGGFGLHNNSSDEMLKEIFKSPYFRKVIVTQPVTRKYLLDKNLCKEENIIYEFGGYSQFSASEIQGDKSYFPNDKETIDICFTAFKYSEKGIDKGYDLFIDVAKRIVKKYANVNFHVIGNFDSSDIDVTELKDRITFYGILDKEKLIELYSKIDICMSPSRPFKLYEGNFDGFPLGFEAMFFKILLMATDELNNNECFNDDEIVVIKPDVDDICNKLENLIENPKKMYLIANNGYKKCFAILEPSERIKKITSCLQKELNLLNGDD